jgi:hypothetical protein
MYIIIIMIMYIIILNTYNMCVYDTLLYMGKIRLNIGLDLFTEQTNFNYTTTLLVLSPNEVGRKFIFVYKLT